MCNPLTSGALLRYLKGLVEGGLNSSIYKHTTGKNIKPEEKEQDNEYIHNFRRGGGEGRKRGPSQDIPFFYT